VQIEVKTKARLTRSGEPEVVLTMTLLPRGSGNRGHVRRLGQVAKNHPIMGPYVKRVICGSSRLTLHLRAGLGLMKAVLEITSEVEGKRDIPGQLPLFS
jgi:hypothetical protein